jgi:hypothetical protein
MIVQNYLTAEHSLHCRSYEATDNHLETLDFVDSSSVPAILSMRDGSAKGLSVECRSFEHERRQRQRPICRVPVI